MNPWLCSLLLGVFLSACGGGGGSVSTPPAQIPPPVVSSGGMSQADMNQYLVQSANLDGNVATPLYFNQPLAKRRIDNANVQMADCFYRQDYSVECTWSYPPFGPFVQANGDGGDYIINDGTTVRIAATLDGSQPSTLWWKGPECGYDGWVLFRADADDNWRGFVARLGASHDQAECPGSVLSYTQYRKLLLGYPGIPQTQVIVSEHYNTGSIDSSTAMERFFNTYGWGAETVWQSWTKNQCNPNDGNASNAQACRNHLNWVAQNCTDFGWNSLPGWNLDDCRERINVVAGDPKMTGSQEWNPGTPLIP